MTLDLNHVRMGSGDPVLLVHSLGGTLVMWEPVMEALAAEREVIAVDMPGFGGSPSLPGDVRPSARNLAEATLDFYDTLGIGAKPVVAGISLGGWVAIESGRLGRASGVVGLCTAGFWDKPLGPKRSVARLMARARDAVPRAHHLRPRSPPPGPRQPDPPHRAHDAPSRPPRSSAGTRPRRTTTTRTPRCAATSSATSPTSRCP